MRDAGRVGRTVTLRLRFDDFTQAHPGRTRSTGPPPPPAVLAVARGLLAGAIPRASGATG